MMLQLKSLISIMLIFALLLWNGANLVHHIVVHTHAFCFSANNHEHQDSHKCSDEHQLEDQQNKDGLPHNYEFYEIKPYVTSLIQDNQENLLSTYSPNKTTFSFHYGRIIEDQLLRPPIV